MKENELRIGNFVYAKTTSDNFNVVSEIGNGGSGRGWYVRLANVNHGVWLDFDGRPMIEGIKITTDWLLKLGFEKVDNKYTIKKSKATLVYSDGQLEGFEHIVFIHQLQNLYFCLTETELQISQNKA